MQPPALARYSPRFASPWARAVSAQRSSPRSKSPLLLLPEVVVATVASLENRRELRLHPGLVLRARRLGELRRFGLQPLRVIVELGLLGIDLGQGSGVLLVLGALMETVPCHLHQILEIGRIPGDRVGVVGHLPRRHSGDRTYVLALKRH